MLVGIWKNCSYGCEVFLTDEGKPAGMGGLVRDSSRESSMGSVWCPKLVKILTFAHTTRSEQGASLWLRLIFQV